MAVDPVVALADDLEGIARDLDAGLKALGSRLSRAEAKLAELRPPPEATRLTAVEAEILAAREALTAAAEKAESAVTTVATFDTQLAGVKERLDKLEAP